MTSIVDSWTVVSPGSPPEFPPIATALSEAGRNVQLLSPFPNGHIKSRALQSFLSRELASREHTGGLPTGNLRSVANGWEILAVLAARLQQPGLARVATHVKETRLARAALQTSGFILCPVELIGLWRSKPGLTCVGYSSVAHPRSALDTVQSDLTPRRRKDYERANRLVTRAMTFADLIVVPSSYAARTYVQEGFPVTKIVVRPLGVGQAFLREPPVRTSRATGLPIRLVYAGRLTFGKGLPALVAEVASDERFSLTLVGTRNPTMKLPASERVTIVDAVKRAELPEIYAAHDVFVSASPSEAFGLGALEAMACGLPALVSKNSLGPDLINDGLNSFVFSTEDERGLRDALDRLATSDLIHIGAAARRSAENLSAPLAAAGIVRGILDCLAD